MSAMETMPRSRLKVGIDVPWVTSWSAEPVTGAGACLTTPGLMAVQQREQAGFGRPLYSQNHHFRQRVSMLRMLCPMCGKPTAKGDRWTLTAKRKTAGQLRAEGKGDSVPADLPDARVVIDAGAVAPLHKACAERSAVQCPHLSADPALDLRSFVIRWKVSPLYVPLAEGAPADMPPIVAFLQLCGVTDATDRRWQDR
jgi:hypothetical protein